MAATHQVSEQHFVGRAGWLRAAVLGANDGLLSTASLIVGVASANSNRTAVLVAGSAGLIAGAMSMAAGEYVSVSSQHDSEQADLRREAEELRRYPAAEERELAGIHVRRGLDADLARQVARELMKRNPLDAHVRDELGITDINAARPLQAALASAASFSAGAAAPLAVTLLVPHQLTVPLVAFATLLFLAILGALGAKAGGAPTSAAMLRVTFWGALAMLITALLAHSVGAAL